MELFIWNWSFNYLWIWKQKGGSLRSTRLVIGACWKIFNNKSCYNFGYGHEIAFCTAVKNLSQIGQPWFFTFSWGPPFANIWIFLHWHFMSGPLKIQRGDSMKKWKIKVVRFASNFAQLNKMQFYAYNQNFSNIYYWKFFNRHK